MSNRATSLGDKKINSETSCLGVAKIKKAMMDDPLSMFVVGG